MAEREDPPTGSGGTSRRAVLLGAGAIGAASLLAACGPDATTPGTPTSTPEGTSPPANTGAPVTQDPSPPATLTPAAAAIKAADIPVGGGMIFAEMMTVVTQPTAGKFKAFDSTCQHMGCPVGSIANRLITCGCHGSQYHIEDGSVARGPTRKGLIPKTVTVTGDTLTIS